MTEFDRADLERTRQELFVCRRDLARLSEASQLEKARFESEIAHLRSTADSLQATIDGLTMQRNKESRLRTEQAKQVEDLRADNLKLRKELAAALDSKSSHLRVPQVSFEQYKELLNVLQSYQAIVNGGAAVPSSTLEGDATIAIATAKNWVARMEQAPFSAASTAADASAGMSAASRDQLQDHSGRILFPTQRLATASASSVAVSPPPPRQQPASSSPQRSGSTGATAPVHAEPHVQPVTHHRSATATLRESIVEGGKLVKIITDISGSSASAHPGSGTTAKQWSIQNTTSDTQFIVEYTFGAMSTVDALGDTEADGATFRLNLYPHETKPFVAGVLNGYKMAVSFGPPDEGYVPPTSMTDSDIIPLLDRVRTVWRRAGAGADVSDVAAVCVSESTPFLDVDFPPLSSSVVRAFELMQDETPPTLHWLPPAKFLPRGTVPELCRSAVTPTSLTTHPDAEDGWLVSGFAALAEDPNIIGQIFSPTTVEDESAGVFSTWINKHGLWNIVSVDSYFPCREVAAVNGESTRTRVFQLYGARSQNSVDLWPAVLEKVVAKCHGSYLSLRHGDVLEALQDLTGFPTERFDWAREKDTAVFSAVHRALSAAHNPGNGGSNVVMVASATSVEADAKAIRGIGLRPHCAYRVVAAVAVEQFRLVLVRVSLRNETGRWSGDWSEESALWQKHPNVKKACQSAAAGIEHAASSCVWMEWRDATRYFGGCGICYLRPAWLDIRLPMRFVKTKAAFMVELSASTQVRMFAGLHQKDRRGLPTTDPDHLYGAFLLSVVSWNSFGGWDVIANSHGGTFWRGRDAFLEMKLTANEKPYYLIARRYSAEGNKEAVLSLHVEQRDGVTIALKEVSDEILGSLRFSPLQRFDPALCAPVQRIECQIEREPRNQLVW